MKRFVQRLQLFAITVSVVALFPGVSRGQTTTHTFNRTEQEVSHSRRINLITQPYQQSNTIWRRVHYILLEKGTGLAEVRAVDSMLRTPKLETPTLPANQGLLRALQPVLFEGNNKVRDFRTLYAHPADILTTWRVISAQEKYQVRPFKLIPRNGRMEIEYLTANNYMVQKIHVSGSGNKQKEDLFITVAEPMDGFDIDLTEGRFEKEGGPENFDEHKFTIIPAGLVVDGSHANTSRSIKVSLATRPSIAKNNGMLDGNPALTAKNEYRQVSVKLSSANSLIRFNGQGSRIITFDATNWNSAQNIPFTIVGDGNGVVGRGGSDTITIEVDKNQPRHDAFFSGLKKTVGVTIPDDDTSPTITSFVIDDGTAQRSVINTLTLSFDRPITIQPNAFSLLRDTGAVDLKYSQILVGGRSVVTIEFEGEFTRPNGALKDGGYSFSINREKIVDQYNNRLDNNFSRSFATLFGNTGRRNSRNELIVTATDYNLFRRTFRKEPGERFYNRIFDWNGVDGVNTVDLNIFRRNLRR